MVLKFGAVAVADEISFARPYAFHSIHINADTIERWESGDYEVLHLKGAVEIRQEDHRFQGDAAIVWVEKPGESEASRGQSPTYKVICYLEGNVEILIPSKDSTPANKILDASWLGRLYTSGSVSLKRASRELAGATPDIFERATRQLSQGWQSKVQPAAFQQDASLAPPVNSSPGLLVNPQTGELQRLMPAVESTPSPAPFTPPARPIHSPLSFSPPFALPLGIGRIRSGTGFR